MKKYTLHLFAAAMLVAAPVLSSAQSNNPLMPVGPKQEKADVPSVDRPKPMTQITSDNPFPPTNPRLFTAAQPAPATMEGFLKALWGFDSTRIWSVASIEKTAAEGVSKVQVLVTTRGGGGTSMQRAIFYVLPDQKHVLSSDALMPFGEHPFADLQKLMLDRANGPAKGATDKGLLLVEFADLQCARCANAQSIMAQLAQDFPQARIVFENIPVEGHPASYQAATFGVCIAKQSNDAFFNYVQGVYDAQSGLTTDGTENTLKTAAGKAGVDTAALSSCAADPSTKQAVEETVSLGKAAGVTDTPVLFINGRLISIAGNVPYETIKSIVMYQAAENGVKLPSAGLKLNTLK